ncbi:MAG: UbiA-like polyprenyltransferase [Planctomycetota bacterium]
MNESSMSSGVRSSAPTIADWLRLVKFSHTIFALPFGLIALFVAADGLPSLRVLGLMLAAMVAARTAAMAYNRYADRVLDAQNPRTSGREIPSGKLRARTVLFVALAAGAVFIAVSFLLNRACGWLSIPVLGFLLGYSHAKRFTALCHLWLGIALGLACPAAWLAVRGALDSSLLVPGVLGAAVAVWVLGFDLIYACQDIDFDRRSGLHSLPSKLGARRALWLARFAHVLAIAGFVGFGVLAGLGIVWHLGVTAAAVLLFFEHKVVSADDLSRVDLAFFRLNGAVGVAMLAVAAIDLAIA